MNAIAFDTCLGACSAAMRWREQPGGPWRTAWRYEEAGTGNAERLMPMLEAVRAESGRRLEELDSIVVTEGPGTFTGVRVGVAAARALALATGLPVRSTTSLHVMACQARVELEQEGLDYILAVCAEARGQVFAQQFGASLESLTPPLLLSPEEVAALSPDLPLLCVGTAAERVADTANRRGRLAVVRLPRLQPNALHLTALAPHLPVRERLAPLYLRPPDAQPQSAMALSRAS
jgi:tRNA threonylcarbamoyladenosine biosynthesis protein TsaB